jgi:quercetin dioxygenase-like cupin family protein
MNDHSITSQPATPIPADNPQRPLKIAKPDTDQSLPHIGLVGDTYTVLLSGNDTNGRYCLIDMHIPPGGGPPPHRHDFEESFTLLVGEIEATFRGEKSTVRAGETLSIPANAPHSFTNASKEIVRLLCLCAPAGQEEFFRPGWRSNGNPHDYAPEARQRCAGSLYEEGQGPYAQIPNGDGQARSHRSHREAFKVTDMIAAMGNMAPPPWT